MSPDAVWMAPLANMAFLAGAALVLSLAAYRWPRLTSARVVLFLSSWIFLWSMAGAFTSVKFIRIHRYTWPILAAGISVQVARLASRRASEIRTLVRRTTPALVFVIVAVTSSVYGRHWTAKRHAVAALPPATPGAPNVLLVVLDTVRAESLSLYGYGRDTMPNLRRLAQSGVVFDTAVSTTSWTLPSHASLFTGRFPHELSASWRNPLDGRYPTLAEVLERRGYVTAGFTANWGYTTADTGLNRGFIHYDDYPISAGMAIKSSWLAATFTNYVKSLSGNIQDLARTDAARIRVEFLNWLSQTNRRPFFAFLNFFDAHGPYLPPPPFNAQFGPPVTPPDLAELRRDWSPEQVQAAINGYDGSLAYLDQQLGALIDDLQARQLLENTLVVITSDHGEQFGEHGLYDHGNSLYWPLLRVPLLILLPSQVPAGRRVAEPVSLRDVPATVLDLLNLSEPYPLPGESLANYWEPVHGLPRERTALLSEVEQGINLPPWSPVSKGNMKSVVVNGLHYIRNGDGAEELYDLASDSAERHNLAGDASSQTLLEECRRSLRILMQTK